MSRAGRMAEGRAARRRGLGIRCFQVSPELHSQTDLRELAAMRLARPGFCRSCQASLSDRLLQMLSDATVRTSSMLIRFAPLHWPALMRPGLRRTGRQAEESPAYAIEVTDVSSKVGEPAVHARHVAHSRRLPRSPGLQQSRDRALGVGRWRRVRPGGGAATFEEGGLDFAVGLRATKPGRHPINGLFRVGYIHGTDEFAMVSLRLSPTSPAPSSR